MLLRNDTRANADGSIDYSWKYDNYEEALTKFQELCEQKTFSKVRCIEDVGVNEFYAQALAESSDALQK